MGDKTQDDAGLLDYKSASEVSEYMENLGLRFEFGCKKEHNPTSCHSLAQWFETYKTDVKRCAEILQMNCFDMKYGDSCFKYGVFKLFGKEGVPRDPLAAYQAFEFGCKSADHGKSCQGAGRLIAEGLVSHSPSLTPAIPMFERGCHFGLAESCFHLGGASITLANRMDKAGEKSKGQDSPSSLRKKAFDAWSKGCELGHELCCRNVARMYSVGDGIPVNESKADEFRHLAEKIASDRLRMDTEIAASTKA
ncbi:hypothetical protein CRM22_006808 [Opisthorchis felineus]|uniref:Cytochrome c oxidase assembly factor 7 n=1 Tax=Opisthorchis felineus TaxID=147828 RepID=A0A4S2LJ15_OPIFE|nr:hypothetical protein CRM22_006808 [Opisthorchis felineus]